MDILFSVILLVFIAIIFQIFLTLKIYLLTQEKNNGIEIKKNTPKDNIKVVEWQPPESEEEIAFKETIKNL